MFNQGNPSDRPPQSYVSPRNKGLIAGLIKGNQWLISPDHKALFLGRVALGGVARIPMIQRFLVFSGSNN